MRPSRLTAALALALPLILPAPATAAQARPAWPLRPLTTAQDRIVDTAGRTVLLRGVNVNQLNDYAVNDPALPAVLPLDRTDFAEMAALGFNVVRLNIAWSALEPRPGAFDRSYVARIRRAVRDAADHGMYTVLDMHQDAWGKTVGTPAGQTCPPPLEPGLGWDGAPGWATITDGWSTCTAGGVREISPAVARAFQNFYDDRAGVQTHLVRTWGRLAAEFANDPAVAGYDLLNEPNPGLRPPVAAADQIGRFYRRAIEEIRAAEARAGGFAHLVFFEPSVLWSALGADALPPGRLLRDDRLVFSPHLYAGSISVTGRLVSIERGFALARRAARRYGAPLWIGEWGWFGDPAGDGPKVRRYAAAEDAHRIGGAWWVWKQSCGDPHSVGGGVPATGGGLNRLRCPSGESLGRPPEFTGPLSRAYPRAAPGRINALAADPAGPGLSMTGTAPARPRDCRLEVWAPGSERPATASSGVAGLRVQPVPGGWRISGCAGGTYRLEVSRRR